MASVRDVLRNYIKSGRTLLCGGPMSPNCIRALVESSAALSVPLVITASRRQVDSVRCGGGYVFSTKNFVEYVKKLCAQVGNTVCIYLERDHGGPGQGDYKKEKTLSFDDSLKMAKLSFEEDIKNGFEILHIDPSSFLSGDEGNTASKVLEIIFELYEYCYEISKKYKKEVEFEIGAEVQTKDVGAPEQFEYIVTKVADFCKKRKFKSPLFFVGQTGACVLEDKNVGISANLDKDTFAGWYRKVKQMSKICAVNGSFLKEHNGDYLDTTAILIRPIVGVGGVNVAPEFAVAETSGLFYMLKILGMDYEVKKFVEISVKSEKWKRWVSTDYIPDERKALLCGHYIYKEKKITKMIEKARRVSFLKYGIDLDRYLTDLIKGRIYRYLSSFNR